MDGGIPVLNQDSGRRQLERERHGPAEPVDPAHRESQGRVDEAGRISGEAPRDRDVRGHLAQAAHDRIQDESDEYVRDEAADGARCRERRAAAEEQACAYCPADCGDELEVPPVKLSLELGRLGLQVLPASVDFIPRVLRQLLAAHLRLRLVLHPGKQSKLFVIEAR